MLARSRKRCEHGRNRSRKMRCDLTHEPHDAPCLAAVRVEVRIVDDKAPTPATACAERALHNLREVPPPQPSGSVISPRPRAPKNPVRRAHPDRCAATNPKRERKDAGQPRFADSSRICGNLVSVPQHHTAGNRFNTKFAPPRVVARAQHRQRLWLQRANGLASMDPVNARRSFPTGSQSPCWRLRHRATAPLAWRLRGRR